MKLNRLDKIFKTVNGEIVDFTQLNKDGWSPLAYALNYNNILNLNLSHEQFDYLIKKSDLNQVNKGGFTALVYALSNNKLEKLNLNEEQFNILIFKTNLYKIDSDNNWSPLMYALYNNKENDLNLTNKQWKYMIEQSDVSLINKENLLLELKKIQSVLLNEEILNKIDINKEIKKNHKI